MIISKEDYKMLQKEGGGFGGIDLSCVAKFISGPIDLPLNTIGSIEVRSNGVFFDVILGKKVFIPIDSIQSTNVVNNNIEFIILYQGNEISLIFGIDKEKDLKKLCEVMIQRKGSLSAVNKVEMDEPEPSCPKCHSKYLNVQRKGYGVGKAAVGGLLAGPLGLLAGGIGKNKLELTCLKCGHKFKPGS